MNLRDDTSIVPFRARDSYDQRTTPQQDSFPIEDTGLRRSHIDNFSNRHEGYSPGPLFAQKRHASYPTGDDSPSRHALVSESALCGRRESDSRASPTSRFPYTSSSVPSTASAPTNDSYSSSPSVPRSSISSISLSERLSPDSISPGVISHPGLDMSDSPGVASLSLNPSPRPSLSRTNHTRALSKSRPLIAARKLFKRPGLSKHKSLPKFHDAYVCECCSKKRKKFDSREELKHGFPAQ